MKAPQKNTAPYPRSAQSSSPPKKQFLRNVINRYFSSLGHSYIKANQKRGAKGRERAFVSERFNNRNALATDATARLFAEIVLGRCVSPERSAEMMELRPQDPFSASSDADDQAHDFTRPGALTRS